MGSGVDFLQGLDGHLGVYLGGFEAGVAQHLLDEADIGSAFEHQGGHGVAEEVTGTLPVDTRLSDIIAHQGADVLKVQGLAVPAD